MSPVPSTGSTNSANSATAANLSSPSTDENMFLQLLVAQLKNQDPTQPMDSTTFVTQLAQFQQLEATNNMGTTLTGIQSNTGQLVTDFSSAAAADSGSTNSTNQS